MTRTISIITAVAGLALVVAVPALGKGQTVSQSDVPIVSPDALDRADEARLAQQATLATSGRGLVFDDHRSYTGIQSAGRSLVFDDYRVDPVGQPVQVVASGSGDELEWPQFGLGLGLGIALAVGLFLTVRYTRARPLAH
jgi:hypothetical protein